MRPERRNAFPPPWPSDRAKKGALSAFGDLFTVYFCGYLVLVSALGGACRENTLPLTLVELACLPLAALAAFRLKRQRLNRESVLGVGLAGVAVLVPALQLVPLPADLWASLPGHARVAAVLAEADLATVDRPLTLAPDLTFGHLLALAPPVAVFLATLAADFGQRRAAVLALSAVGAVSLVMALVQLSGLIPELVFPYGPDPDGSAVGLFANRNHFAAMLVVLIPLILSAAPRPHVGESADARRFALAMLALFLLITVVAVAVTRSRMGVVLVAPVALAAVAWLRFHRAAPEKERSRSRLVLASVVVVGAVLSLGAIGASLQQRFVHGDNRVTSWPLIARTAMDFMPWGAGVGSFDPVHRSVEPVSQVEPTYLNHAHNEYLELWQDAGLPALVGMAAFLALWGHLAIAASRRGVFVEADMLARGAVLASAILLIWSLVDYPLRSEALACLFAFACGVMTGRDRTNRAAEPPARPSPITKVARLT